MQGQVAFYFAILMSSVHSDHYLHAWQDSRHQKSVSRGYRWGIIPVSSAGIHDEPDLHVSGRLRKPLRSCPSITSATSRLMTPERVKTMSVVWPVTTRLPPSMTSPLALPTAGPASESPDRWRRMGRGIWRTADPPPTVTPMLWQKSLSGLLS